MGSFPETYIDPKFVHTLSQSVVAVCLSRKNILTGCDYNGCYGNQL